jgi:hypothetical protein
VLRRTCSPELALRHAISIFTRRQPFDVLRPADVGMLVDIFARLPEAGGLGFVFFEVDKRRDAFWLKDAESVCAVAEYLSGSDADLRTLGSVIDRVIEYWQAQVILDMAAQFPDKWNTPRTALSLVQVLNTPKPGTGILYREFALRRLYCDDLAAEEQAAIAGVHREEDTAGFAAGALVIPACPRAAEPRSAAAELRITAALSSLRAWSGRATPPARSAAGRPARAAF